MVGFDLPMLVIRRHGEVDSPGRLVVSLRGWEIQISIVTAHWRAVANMVQLCNIDFMSQFSLVLINDDLWCLWEVGDQLGRLRIQKATYLYSPMLTTRWLCDEMWQGKSKNGM